MAENDTQQVICWCYTRRKYVTVTAEVTRDFSDVFHSGSRWRQSYERLNVVDCLELDCSVCGALDCLVGKMRTSSWNINYALRRMLLKVE